MVETKGLKGPDTTHQTQHPPWGGSPFCRGTWNYLRPGSHTWTRKSGLCTTKYWRRERKWVWPRVRGNVRAGAQIKSILMEWQGPLKSQIRTNRKKGEEHSKGKSWTQEKEHLLPDFSLQLVVATDMFKRRNHVCHLPVMTPIPRRERSEHSTLHSSLSGFFLSFLS